MSMPMPPEKPKNMKERPSRARYGLVRQVLETKWRRREIKNERVMRELVDVLWENFEASPYSWCGFYLLGPDGKNLVPGPHRGEPAPAPMALEGFFSEAVNKSEGVIAAGSSGCSEIAVPAFDQKGKIWAVLHVQAKSANAFDDMDRRWLEQLLRVFSSVEE